MSSRRKWEFELFTHAAPDVCAAVTRAIAREDVPAIASIMYRAFQGTVDDEGMPEERAARKVNAIIDGKYGPFIAAASRVAIVDGECAAFLLATDYEPYGMPVIAAIAVAPEYRRRRYGRLLLQAATQALATLGYCRCCAMISPGNAASEALFVSIGFKEAQLS
ncbi:GNAT family N-acetyltransferase [Paraburkholderia sp. GAS82]|uniref:GNAT family N-acetyltransferase n=1 Tax=Paraburkholderia sp. GAS82 TaxID=3035137 RepID=UPI003D22666C